MEFVVLAGCRLKFKESQKIDKYFDLTREQKNYGTRKWRGYEL